MTSFSAFFYEGILALSVLILYFVIEPRLKDEKGFFTARNIATLCLMLPFAEFIVGFLLQSSDCSTSNLYCVGTPDIFKHSLYYDIFYLRVNDTTNGAHWIDYMFLPMLFFFSWFVTKDGFFSALNAGFMVFIHELIWFIFYWIVYYVAFQYEGWINDIAFFVLVCSIGVIGMVKYKKYYWNWFFVSGLLIYGAFLTAWLTFDNFHVTVINNTQIGNALKFLVTQWYYEPLANEFEVFSWILIFCVFLLNLALVERKNTKVTC